MDAPEARLADAGRADQRDHGGQGPAPAVDRRVRFVDAPLGAQLAHGEVLDDAVLDLVEAGVVGVEHGAGVGQVEVVVGALAPRQLEHGVEPRADPAVLHGLRVGALEPADLALDGRAHVVGRALERGQLLAVGRPPRPLRRPRPAPCGWRPSAGAAGTRAAGFSMPSETSVRMRSASSSSARASLAQARTFSTRASTSMVSSSSTLRSSERSGHQPAASASSDGSSMPRSISVRRRPPMCSSTCLRVARSSRASSRARSVGSPSVDGLGLEPERLGGADHAGAQTGPAFGPDDQRRGAAGQGAARLDAGDRRRRGRSRRRCGGRGGGGRRRRRRSWPPSPRRSRGRWSPPSAGGRRRWSAAARGG